MDIKDIRPYPKNAKKHDKKQIQQVANSIKRFGFVQPIVVDKNNEVVIGHCRLEAAKLLDLKEVPTISVDKLTDDEVKALRLADNKLNESDWEMGLAIEDLMELGPDTELFDLTGFDRYVLNLNEAESVDVGLDNLGVITIMPPESPKLKEKAILYVDNLDDYKKIKEVINNGELGVNEILKLL